MSGPVKWELIHLECTFSRARVFLWDPAVKMPTRSTRRCHFKWKCLVTDVNTADFWSVSILFSSQGVSQTESCQCDVNYSFLYLGLNWERWTKWSRRVNIKPSVWGSYGLRDCNGNSLFCIFRSHGVIVACHVLCHVTHSVLKSVWNVKRHKIEINLQK